MSTLDFKRIRGDLHKWIEAFLRNRIQKVMLKGMFFSFSSKVPFVVPQGTVLGPTFVPPLRKRRSILRQFSRRYFHP